MIAALFVETDGVYFGLPEVDPWDEQRDARKYKGPWPVVAHPPCARWGAYWWGGPSALERKKLGDDGGCFAAALWAVRTFGGLIEHPAYSRAWKWFGITPPRRNGGWTELDQYGGSSCCVEQHRYGHEALKATWLYAVGVRLPELRWGRSPPGTGRPWDNYRCHTPEERRRARRTGICQRLSNKQRKATPVEFRDLLLLIANNTRIVEEICAIS